MHVNWICGLLFTYIEITNSKVTKLWAIRFGLQFAWNRDYRYMQFQTNSILNFKIG